MITEQEKERLIRQNEEFETRTKDMDVGEQADLYVNEILESEGAEKLEEAGLFVDFPLETPEGWGTEEYIQNMLQRQREFCDTYDTDPEMIERYGPDADFEAMKAQDMQVLGYDAAKQWREECGLPFVDDKAEALKKGYKY